MLDTLGYLRRSGRGDRVVSMASSLLSLKPILCINTRGVHLMARPRTQRRAHRIMPEEMCKQPNQRPAHVAVMHADAQEQAEQIREKVASDVKCVELLTTEFTPVVGFMTGPGLVGVAFYRHTGG